MITIYYRAECDGWDPHDSEHPCEASFEITEFTTERAAESFDRNLTGRGWRRDGNKLICPLHPQAEP